MDDCHPWLDCDGVKRVKLGERLKFGLGKEVFDADWNGHTVAYVRLRPERLHQGLSVQRTFTFLNASTLFRPNSEPRANGHPELDSTSTITICHPSSWFLLRGSQFDHDLGVGAVRRFERLRQLAVLFW